MKKAKNKHLKKYILWGLMALVVAGLAVMPLLATSTEEAEGPQASILSGTVQTGNVEVSVRGGGNLEATDYENVELPSGVKITGFLVENGDMVTEGTPLASIDRVTLMDAITQVQDTLEYLQEEMADVKDDTISSYIYATAGGRIKKVYAQEGEDVQEVMLRDGALAVLSLDGLMAVDIERNMPLSTGETVCVTFEDDTEVSGRVETNLNGKIVITIDDEGYAIGEKVTVTTDEGTRVGSGQLYVHNAWTATGFSGTISTVYAEEEKTVYSGSTLFTLKNTDYTAEMESLAKEHREYEQLLQDMIIMYENGAILAPCDGLVSGIDTESTHLLAADEEVQWEAQLLSNTQTGEEKGWTVMLLSNTTLGDALTSLEEGLEQLFSDNSDIPDSWTGVCTMDESCTAQVHSDGCPAAGGSESDSAETSYTGWAAFVLAVDGESIWVMVNPTGITVADPSNVTLDTNLMTEVASVDLTTYTDGSDIAAGDCILLLDGGGAIKLSLAASSDGSGGSAGDLSGLENKGAMSSAISGMGSGSSVQTPAFEPYPLEGSTLMTVTAQESMRITITVDEQDIAKIHQGQAAQVKVSALRGQVFEGEVTEVAISGTNSGGSSKFTVEVTLPASEDMISGMTATVSIPLYTKMDVLTIPVAALTEDGTKTVVCIALDAESGEPASPVAVTTGVSDGETVEILSGLNNGDSFYYSYYDTLELSTAVEKANSGFSFR